MSQDPLELVFHLRGVSADEEIVYCNESLDRSLKYALYSDGYRF